MGMFKLIESVRTVQNYNDVKLLSLEESKEKLHQLFIIYSDYSLESGELFLKKTVFLKILKESGVIGGKNYKLIT